MRQLRRAADRARWLHEMLKGQTRDIYKCQAVVAIPGWFINQMDDATRAVAWVLEPKALLKWIPREPVRLTPEDVRRIEAAIAGHVRRAVE